MTDTDLIDPLLGPHLKGWPHDQPPRRASELAAAGWQLLADTPALPLPLAVLKRSALAHNIGWLQRMAGQWRIDLAPHGKTTMSPQLFRRQLDAGAWGISFATVHQAAIGAAAGVQRALVANQVVTDHDLAAIRALRARHAGLRVLFLLDSAAQLALIEGFAAARPPADPFEVLLEVGVPGGRTGVRDHAAALALARAAAASPAVRLAGIECYEGLAATGSDADDIPYADALMARVEALAQAIDAEGLFAAGEVIVSAGGSAIFDLVATRLTPRLTRPVRGLLRSGCYVTHDHGHYKRLVQAVERRCGCADAATPGLQPALEVWTAVQSVPEPGLALLTAGRRDLSFDIALPTPIARAPRGVTVAQPVPAGWAITALNDQHAYLRWDAADAALAAAAPQVGERIALGISHPCTTFDKWHWMPVVDDAYRIVDAVTMHF